MRKVTHRAFAPRSIELFKIKSYEAIAEEVRREAEEFIQQIGPENVVSITENSWRETLTVVVWYHAS